MPVAPGAAVAAGGLLAAEAVWEAIREAAAAGARPDPVELGRRVAGAAPVPRVAQRQVAALEEHRARPAGMPVRGGHRGQVERQVLLDRAVALAPRAAERRRAEEGTRVRRAQPGAE
jgi:hypothetical protein